MMGTTEASQDISFAAMSKLQQQVARIVLADPAVDTHRLVHRRGRGQLDRQQRPHVHHAQTASERERQRRQIINRLRRKTVAGRRASICFSRPCRTSASADA